ncbi:hypothetical protein Cs7R123_73990 [Catellatospora sp. TT07R-123]|uniref:hypothetical protein n=1 Tax=Catellatospora sp. TT07R-123 TaxID=2733863 RepID=UPI001B23CF51|nr:hypothetical protein [Catellatospora sp. TT07R-123]GHJ50057.1 hypothetical protein Cs7R123_73990 [Catellatospora sp. TT07R-123]
MSGSGKSSSPVEHVGGRAPERFGWLWGLAGFAGVAGVIAAYVLFGASARAALLGFACDVTACSTVGMTAAGWLVVSLAAVALPAVGLCWARSGPIARRALAAAAVAAVALPLLFLPGRRRSMSDMISGPGADQFGSGFMWALGGIGAVIAALLVLAAVSGKARAVNRNFNAIAGVLGAALMVAALPVAVANTYPTYVRADEIFPAVLTMNGDTLTRTSASDQRGCDGVLPDDALLNRENCYLTVRAAFTTDDSDAVVTFRAVLYRDDETADAVRAGLPSGMDLAETTGDASTTFSTNGPWVLLGSAAHADGHEVGTGERNWVLWPLRQVSYHFIGAQAGIFIDPDPKDEIHPRTP